MKENKLIVRGKVTKIFLVDGTETDDMGLTRFVEVELSVSDEDIREALRKGTERYLAGRYVGESYERDYMVEEVLGLLKCKETKQQ